MDSDILNIEDIVMGRALPDPPPEVPAEKPPEPRKPVSVNGPPATTIQPYQHENLQCFQCFITFCSAKAKERHMKKSHREEYKQQLQQGNTLFTCYVCDRTFSSSVELTEHQPTHSKDDKPFKCAHCKESFKTFTELTSHRRKVCPERLMACKDCNETFRSPVHLRTHRLTVHPRLEAENAQQQQQPPPDDDSKTHRCQKCGQGFDTEPELVAHQEKYPEGQQCNGSSSTNKKRARPTKVEDPAGAEKKGKRKKKVEGEASEEAVEAGGASESAAAAATPAEEKGKAVVAKRGRAPKAAAKSDTEDKKSPGDDAAAAPAKEKKPKAEPAPPRQHPCPDCDFTFPTLVQLRTHKKEKHTPRKAHPCDECEESFARQEQLDAHMSRAHAVGRFACTTCGKSFGRERTLLAHQKAHAEEEKAENSNAKR